MRKYNKTYKRQSRHVRGPYYKQWLKEYLVKYNRERFAANPEETRRKWRENTAQWTKKNPQAALACYRRFREKHPDATRKQCQRIEVRIARNIRNRVWYAVKRGCKAGSAVRDLGCSIKYFKDYIASMFSSGMSWENYGKWHLDHIIPISSFDLTDREHFIRACHYTNYQPLWAVDNLRKGTSLKAGMQGGQPQPQGQQPGP